jgi:hypothetical protein
MRHLQCSRRLLFRSSGRIPLAQLAAELEAALSAKARPTSATDRPARKPEAGHSARRR